MNYLWCNPNMKTWQRLALGAFYLPMLFWWWLVGNPIVLLDKEKAPDGFILHSCNCPRCGLTYSEPFDPRGITVRK